MTKDRHNPSEQQAVGRSQPDPIGKQRLFDPSSEKHVDASVYLREQLLPGDRLSGPALITESQTTTVITANYEARISEQGHVIMSRLEEGNHGQ